jgi:hypothetical protein
VMAVVASTPLSSRERARDGAHNNSTRKAAKYFISIPSLKSNWQRYYTLLKGWTESLWSALACLMKFQRCNLAMLISPHLIDG